MTVVESPGMKVLLERRTAGFNVEVGVIPTTGEVVLKAWTENYHAKVPILPEHALAAYTHPCAFIPNADRFFRDLKDGEPSEDVVEEPAEVIFEAVVTEFCHGCERSLFAHETGEYCDNCRSDAA